MRDLDPIGTLLRVFVLVGAGVAAGHLWWPSSAVSGSVVRADLSGVSQRARVTKIQEELCSKSNFKALCMDGLAMIKEIEVQPESPEELFITTSNIHIEVDYQINGDAFTAGDEYFINGTLVVDDGELTWALPGVVITPEKRVNVDATGGMQ